MDEPILDLSVAKLSPQKEMVRVFYKELWDHADKSLIPSLFHTDFTFRGSRSGQRSSRTTGSPAMSI